MIKKLTVIAFILCIFAQSQSHADTKAKVFNDVRNSVVLIKAFEMPNMGVQSSISQGSGYIVNKEGYIITNHHVIEDAKGLYVYIEDNEGKDTIPAYTLWSDEDLDLAVIKVEHAGLIPVEIAEPGEIYQGAEILVLGYPMSANARSDIKVTWGLLSSSVKDSTIQTNAAINPGNSGGPAVNLDGKVVGTVFSKFVGLSVENTGFLRNIKYMKMALDSARKQIDSLKEFCGTENLTAYKKLCLAEANYETIEDMEDMDSIMRILPASIKLAKEAVSIDTHYTEAYYFLANYYLKESFVYCENYETAEADSTASIAYNFIEKAKAKTSYSEYADYKDDLEYKMEDLLWEDQINCKRWRIIQEFITDNEEEREKRMEEFYDYLYFGETPDRLKYALEHDIYFGRKERRKKLDFYRMGITYTNILTISGDYVSTPQTYAHYLEINQAFGKYVRLYYGIYPAVFDLYHDEWVPEFQMGLMVYSLFVKYNFADVTDEHVPKFEFGYTGPFPGMFDRGHGHMLTLSVLLFENDRFDADSNIGVKGGYRFHLTSGLYLNIESVIYFGELYQFPIGISYIFQI